MIDTLTSLSFSVFSERGVYALLLGSGVSRAAEIPTGWDVTLDLVRKLAAVSNESCDPDPASWYKKRFGAEPDYSALLESLAITPSERTNLLSGYFEATPEERELGKKIPTVAHKAIARLASRGYFRVILTTNFDRLIEQALEAEGLNPTVISTADMVNGAMPMAHAQCTVIKMHGDYRDTRLKNTSEELGAYPVELNDLLDRVFDEYGLIVCGWSATWDRALCSAILRSPNRRFSVYWALRGAPSVEAADIIRFKQASSVEIESADKLFSVLEQKVGALESLNKPHPLSVPMAVATLKRFIVEDRFRIELRDLVQDEVERQMRTLAPLGVQLTGGTQEARRLQCYSRMELYESSMEMLAALISNGCFYGTPAQTGTWCDAILRMAGLSTPRGGSTALINLCRYPACLLAYAGGIASVASQNYNALRAVFRESKTLRPIAIGTDRRELIFGIVPGRVVDAAILSDVPRAIGAPVSDRLHELLREPLRTLVPDDSAYDDAFDRFEYYLTLIHFEIERSSNDSAPRWAPVGRFVWRGRGFGNEGPHISEVLAAENNSHGANWAPIRSGLFTDSNEFSELNDAYVREILSKIQPW